MIFTPNVAILYARAIHNERERRARWLTDLLDRI